MAWQLDQVEALRVVIDVGKRIWRSTEVGIVVSTDRSSYNPKCGRNGERLNWVLGNSNPIDAGSSATARRMKLNGSCRGFAALTAGRDRPGNLLRAVIATCERKIELAPYRDHGVSQLTDQPKVMRRRGGNPQSLRASGNRGVIDRLDVDSVPVKQEVASLLAQIGIADHDRHDMGLRRQHRQAGFPQSRFRRCHGGALARTLSARCLEMSDRGCRGRRYRGRQGCREDKSGSVRTDGVHDGAVACDVAAKRAESLG